MINYMRPVLALVASGGLFLFGTALSFAGQLGTPARPNAPAPSVRPAPSIRPGVTTQTTIVPSTSWKQRPIGSDWWRTYPWSPYNAWKNPYWYPPYNNNYPFAPDAAYPYRPYPVPQPYPYSWGIDLSNP